MVLRRFLVNLDRNVLLCLLCGRSVADRADGPPDLYGHARRVHGCRISVPVARISHAR